MDPDPKHWLLGLGSGPGFYVGGVKKSLLYCLVAYMDFKFSIFFDLARGKIMM
jgi:hypothetical protein